MAISSGIYGQTFIEILKKTAGSPDLDGDTIEWIFTTDVDTTNDFDDTTPALLDITENTITTAGTYTSGGEAIAGQSVGFNGTTHFMYDGNNVALTGTTISSEGVIGFSETSTAPSTDSLLWSTAFGATYASNGGNYDITWDTNGIFRFSLT
jgi:hypothetical protein